jgi:hypothetical protein
LKKLHLGIVFFGIAWLAANVMDIHDILSPAKAQASDADTIALAQDAPGDAGR